MSFQILQQLLDEIGRKVKVMGSAYGTDKWFTLNIERDALTDLEVTQFEGLLETTFKSKTGNSLLEIGWKPFDVFVKTNLQGSAHNYWYWAGLWVSSTRLIVNALCVDGKASELPKKRAEETQIFIGSIRMGDNYTAGQAGAMGPMSQASGNNFQQTMLRENERIDLQILAAELDTLRALLRKERTDSFHDIAIGEVAAAQTAAKEGKEDDVLKHLKNAGKWAFDVSTKVGVGVATQAIKTALGL